MATRSKRRENGKLGGSSLIGRAGLERMRRTLGAASCVSQTARFALNELRDRPATHLYTLRGSDLRVVIRHPLLDMWVLEELFRFRTYAFPREVELALANLPRAPLIADFGGHIGCFGLFALRQLPNGRIVSFEPDPRNAAVLRRCVEVNGLGEQWTVVEACAATRDGSVSFASDFHLSRAAPSEGRSLDRTHDQIAAAFPFMTGTALLAAERREVACKDALPILTDADLVKLDIEGGEWEILDDPRIADLRAAAVVLEYHPALCPDPNPERVVRDSLKRAGLVTAEPVRSHDAGLIWAWRPTSAGGAYPTPAPSSA